MAFLKCIKNSRVIPDGKTALPVGNVQIWLHCADIWDKTYTNLSQVLNDQTTFLKLVTTSNADDYMARSNWSATMCADEDAMEVIGSYDACVDALMQDDTWASAIGGSTYKDKVLPISTPTMTSESEPSGWAYSPSVSASGHEGYKAFDKNTSTWWESTQGYPRWVYYMFPTKQKCYIAYCQGYQYPATAKIRASNNGSNWDDVSSEFSLGSAKRVRVNTTQKYKYYSLYASYAPYWTQVSELDFYCREGGVQSWLEAGGITSKSYTTLAEVLADSTTLNALLASSDAVDYLAECPSWASTICANESAMKAIGASDYASTTLLADNDWCTAIMNSQYSSYVINAKVPTMTSNTTPSGECYGSTAYSGYSQYYAFNNNSNGFVANVSQSMYIAYRFTRAVKIYYVKFKARRCSSVGWVYSVGTNNADYTDVCTGNGNSDTGGTYYAYSTTISNPIAKDTHKIYVNANNSLPAVANLQFYGRENGGVQDWLRSGGITDKSYTTLTEVLADATTLSALIASQDACAYLVTAKGFIEQDICENQAFMTALGNSNYASNLLLNDEDWYEAIKASTYASLVINVTVPKMTGDTTPSGEAYASSYASSYQPWKAFSQSTSYTTCWSWSGTGAVANNAWLAYDFGKAVKIYGVFWQNRTTTTATRPLGTLIVQGSNDKTTWTDVSGTLTGSATASATFNYHFENDNAYRHYRVLVTSTAVSGDTNLIIQQLQFYGREDVT